MRFLVNQVSPAGLVTGRNDGDAIPLGTAFTQITKTRVDGDLNNLAPVDLGVVGSISLKLAQIEWYGRHPEFVPGGHTAGLQLEGSGMEVLISALKSLGKREYVSIVADVSPQIIKAKTGTA